MEKGRLIHVAEIQEPKKGKAYLFLRQLDPYRYEWFKEDDPGQETATAIWGATTEEAIYAARKAWKQALFRTLKCGFRYTLPERDEHGSNALFSQMVASYSSMNGVYFEDELGSNCIVHHASIEACDLWKRLQQMPPM